MRVPLVKADSTDESLDFLPFMAVDVTGLLVASASVGIAWLVTTPRPAYAEKRVKFSKPSVAFIGTGQQDSHSCGIQPLRETRRNQMQGQTLVGVYAARAEANRVHDSLLEAGISESDIRLSREELVEEVQNASQTKHREPG